MIAVSDFFKTFFKCGFANLPKSPYKLEALWCNANGLPAVPIAWSYGLSDPRQLGWRPGNRTPNSCFMMQKKNCGHGFWQSHVYNA